MTTNEPASDDSATADSVAVFYERRDSVALIRFRGVGSMNLLTSSLFEQLEEAFDRLLDEDVVVAVLTGTGDRAFSAGAHLGETVPRITAKELKSLMDPGRRFLSHVYKPIVAAVEGHCLAGGMEMLLGTDVRIAAESASFGLGEVRWGIIPAGGSHIRLPRQVPWAIAMQLILTGHPIDARRALEVGLINEVVPDGHAVERALEVAAVIAANGPLALRTAKEISVRGLHLDGGFELEANLARRVFESQDAVEGPRAFMEKRPPRFEGR